jgi:acyl carrier protein
VTKQQVREAVLRILGTIAPEADLTQLKADVPFRDQLDIDSMDLLNFFIAIDRDLHLAIPEIDYARVDTLDRCVEYIASSLASSAR